MTSHISSPSGNGNNNLFSSAFEENVQITDESLGCKTVVAHRLIYIVSWKSLKITNCCMIVFIKLTRKRMPLLNLRKLVKMKPTKFGTK